MTMEEHDLITILDDFKFLIDQRQDAKLRNILISMHPSDIAELGERLGNNEELVYLFNLMDAETASEAIMELEETVREHLIEKLENRRLSELVDEMDSDDAADFVSEIPEEDKEEVLEHVEQEDVDEVRELLKHPEDTAGGIMALEIIAVRDDSSVDEAIDEIRRKAEEVEDIYNVYVVDKANKLTGMVTMKDLILAKGNTSVANIVLKEVFAVPVNMDQEEVAKLARKYDLVSIPVVDDQDYLLGRITIDDIVDVIQDEATEDIHKMAGLTDEEEIRETAVFKIVKARIPWLVWGLFGGLISAWVMGEYHTTLQNKITLAFFVPIIMAMAGNIGIQSSALVVRGLATGEIVPQDLMWRCFKEIKVALLNGIILSFILLATISTGWGSQDGTAHYDLAILISVSLLIIIVVAGVLGSTIPLVLKKVKVDPALATGPFITTSNDIIGLFLYLKLAELFLGL